MGSVMKRRNFLTASAAAVGGVFTKSAWAFEASSSKDLKWDDTYDVVVVGYGAAGASAAIEAHDNKCSVIILEKSPNGGGNTEISGGGITIPKNA